MPLTAINEQMVRLAKAGIPAREQAAVQVFDPDQLFSWLIEATECDRAQSARSVRKQIWSVMGRDIPAHLQPESRHELEIFGYVNNRTELFPRKLAPASEDRDFDSYIRRMNGTLAGQEFGLSIPWLNAVSWPAHRLLLQLAGPLMELSGIRVSRFNVFFGNYRRTPFGPHLDPHHLHVFQFVVQGHRRLHTWSFDHLLATLGEDQLVEVMQDPHVNSHVLSEGEVFDAQPGDLLYWPGTRMHMVSSEEPSMGVSIVFERSPWRIADVISTSLGTARRPTEVNEIKSTPSEWDEAATVGSVKKELARMAACSDDAALTKEIVRDVLRQQTGRAIGAVPSRRRTNPVAVGDTLTSAIVAGFPIRCIAYGNDLLFAANGHSASWGEEETQDDLRRIIACLNEIPRFRVADLLAQVDIVGSLEPDDICSLLTFFVSAGAFDLKPAGRD